MASKSIVFVLFFGTLAALVCGRPLELDGSVLRLPSLLSDEVEGGEVIPVPVADETGLVAALKNESVTSIELRNDITLTAELPIISRNLTIFSNCSSLKKTKPSACFLSGDRIFRIFQVEAPKGAALNFTLRNVALKNASAEYGAAILFSGGEESFLELVGSAIAASVGTGTSGGAVVHVDSNLILTGTAFAANSGSNPAVVLANKKAVVLLVTGSAFAANKGGALRAEGPLAAANFTGNNWTANRNDAGAALELLGGNSEDSVAYIVGDAFVANRGTDAGALKFDGYRFVVKSGRFVANVAEGNLSMGGAIHAENHKGTSFLTTVTVTANSAAVGAGIYGDGGSIGVCSCLMVANVARTPGAGGNLVFEGDSIAIWPWGSVFGAAGAPVVYDYAQACGSSLTFW